MLQPPSYPHTDIFKSALETYPGKQWSWSQEPPDLPKTLSGVLPTGALPCLHREKLPLGPGRRLTKTVVLKQTKCRILFFLTKLRAAETALVGLHPLMGLSEANPHKVDFLWTGDGYVFYSIYP